METTLEQIKKDTESILKQSDVAYAGIFGSYLHGTARKDSDVDVLVRFSKSKTLFDLIRLEHALSLCLGKKVDVVTEQSLSKYFRDKVMRDALLIYGKR